MEDGHGNEAKEWVKAVITPNDLTSVHELAVAANIEVTPRSLWVTTWPGTGATDPLRHKLRLRDQSLLNDLKLLAEAELKTLGAGSSSGVLLRLTIWVPRILWWLWR